MTWIKNQLRTSFCLSRKKSRFGNYPYIENILYQHSGGSYIIEGEQNPETPDCSKSGGEGSSNLMGTICPLDGIGLMDLQKNWGGVNYPP